MTIFSSCAHHCRKLPFLGDISSVNVSPEATLIANHENHYCKTILLTFSVLFEKKAEFIVRFESLTSTYLDEYCQCYYSHK